MSYPQRSIAAALTLFFVAPLVAEYLLGDLPITLLAALIMLAPMYGGGALLIRELTRRSGRGWPTMLLLGCAYALFEEGFSTQSLFNPNFLGMHLLAPAWIPALGIGAWWTVLMLNVHPLWSMGVSIALAEGLFPSRATTPWLGKIGLSAAALLMVAGAAGGGFYSYRHSHFRASPAQFAVTAVLCILLAIAAFLLPRPAPRSTSGMIPSPWLTASAAFLLGVVIFLTPPPFGWAAVAIMLAADLIALIFVWVASSRSGWTPLHTLSLAAGGAVFYGVHAFIGHPVVRSSRWIVRSGNALFLLLAVALIVIAVRRTRSVLRVGSSQLTSAGA
jgi:hypothetical protein